MTHDPPRIRLALVITELDVGGAERCLVNLALGLDRACFEPVVFVLAPRPASPHDLLPKMLDQAQVPVHFLGCARKWQLGAAVRRLSRGLGQWKPHVVQSMLFHANVVTRLAMRAHRDTAWCAGIRVADPSRLRQFIEGRALRGADRVVCVSQLVADYAARRMGVAGDKLLVVPNGVDIDAATTREPASLEALGLPARKRAITCVARLATQKGIDQLLLAAPHILGSLPEHDLLLVGDGPEAGNLQRQADQSGVTDRIHFCGWQPKIPEILRASDLLVLPSRWEGMPNVLLEAMAAGRPVVCTQVEGVLEVLGTLAQQQTVPVEMPQLLSEKVVAILSDPPLARELGDANRQRVVEHFALSVMVKRYAALYAAVPEGAFGG